MHVRRLAPVAIVVLLLAGAVGCNRQDPRIDALRKQLVLDKEPAGALTIADARDRLKEQPEVVVVGRIQASQFDPWAAGKAAFVLSEAPVDDGGHSQAEGHDAANCPFCKRRAEKANVTATIQFTDEAGQVLPIDSRDLFGLSENQVVVVEGQGQVNDLGLISIKAKGIHLRR